MSKLSKDQVEQLAQELNSPWGRVKLQCDGHEITLEVRRASGRTIRYVIETFVDGVWRGVWMRGSEVHPEQKFLRKSERSVHSPSERARLQRALGKRRAKELGVDKKVVIYHVTWSSGRAALRHLMKVCDAVEILEGA